MQHLLITVLVAFGAIGSSAAGSAAAQSAPAIDHHGIEAGRKLAEKDCVACHVRKFGDAATIYKRTDRKVHTPAQLLAQVRYCNIELGANYFPEDEEHVAAYLNLTYYHFGQ